MPNTIRIVVDTSDLDQLPERIRAVAEQINNGTIIGQVLTKELLDSTDRAFETETDPNTGDPWAEWSPAYAKRLKLLNKHHKKLQDQGMDALALLSGY